MVTRWVLAGMFFQGLHMSAAEGNLKAMVAQSLPLNMRGTGFSIFAMSAGSAVVVGNLMAGFLADQTVAAGLGSIGPFYAGLVSTLAACALLVVFELTLPPDSNRSRFSLFKGRVA
jgi:MFS family permease